MSSGGRLTLSGTVQHLYIQDSTIFSIWAGALHNISAESSLSEVRNGVWQLLCNIYKLPNKHKQVLQPNELCRRGFVSTIMPKLRKVQARLHKCLRDPSSNRQHLDFTVCSTEECSEKVWSSWSALPFEHVHRIALYPGGRRSGGWIRFVNGVYQSFYRQFTALSSV
jgi:hypothetical protein